MVSRGALLLLASSVAGCGLTEEGTLDAGGADATAFVDAAPPTDVGLDGPPADSGLSDAIPDGTADTSAPDAAWDAQPETAPDAPPPDAPADGPPPPTGFAFGTPVLTMKYGGTGGGPFMDPCPPGQVVIGYAGSLDSTYYYIASITTVCGTLILTGSGPWQVTVGAGATLGTHGNGGSIPWAASCPSNQMVMGFSGRSGQFMDQLALYCAPLIVSADGSSVSLGSVSILPAHGDTDGGGPFTETDCPGGSVATGTTGASGAFVDAFALVCRVVSLTH